MGRLSAQHRPDQSKMSQSPSRDLSDLIEQAWKKYRVLSQAPPQLKPLSDAVLSLVGVLRLTLDVVQDCQLSATDQWVINTQNEACRQVFEQLDGSIYSLRSSQVSSDAVATIKEKVLDQVSRLSSYLEVLQGPLKQKISSALSNIPDIQIVAGNWGDLQAELQKLDIPESLAQNSFFFIDNWLKDNIIGSSDAIESPDDTGGAKTVLSRDLAAVNVNDDDEELPGYSPGAKPGTIEEKVQSLEQTSIVMSHSSQLNQWQQHLKRHLLTPLKRDTTSRLTRISINIFRMLLTPRPAEGLLNDFRILTLDPEHILGSQNQCMRSTKAEGILYRY